MHTNLVNRIALARELGVEPQTIAKWERQGWFPEPKLIVSERLILYERSEVETALAERHRRKRERGVLARRRAS